MRFIKLLVISSITVCSLLQGLERSPGYSLHLPIFPGSALKPSNRNFPVKHMQGVRSSFALENPTVLLNKTPAWAVSLHFQLQASPTCCWNPSGCPESELLQWQRNSLDLGPGGGLSSSGCRLAGWALRVDSSWVVCYLGQCLALLPGEHVA